MTHPTPRAQDTGPPPQRSTHRSARPILLTAAAVTALALLTSAAAIDTHAPSRGVDTVSAAAAAPAAVTHRYNEISYGTALHTNSAARISGVRVGNSTDLDQTPRSVTGPAHQRVSRWFENYFSAIVRFLQFVFGLFFHPVPVTMPPIPVPPVVKPPVVTPPVVTPPAPPVVVPPVVKPPVVTPPAPPVVKPPVVTPPVVSPPVVKPPATTGAYILPGDGGIVSAINAKRTALGLAPITGTTVPATQQCALAWKGQHCSPPEIEASINSQDGAVAVGLWYAEGPGGGHYNLMMDPTLKSVAIGWAYHPEVSFGRYVVVVNLRH